MAKAIATIPQQQTKIAPKSGIRVLSADTELNGVTLRMITRHKAMEDARRESENPSDPRLREAIYSDRVLKFWERWWPAFVEKASIHEKIWRAYRDYGASAIDPEHLQVAGIFGKSERIHIVGEYGIESTIKLWRGASRKSDRDRAEWIRREYIKAKRKMRRLRDFTYLDSLQAKFAEAQSVLTAIEDDLWGLPQCTAASVVKAVIGLAGHLDVAPTWSPQVTTDHMVFWTIQFLSDVLPDITVEIANPIVSGIGHQKGWSEVAVCEMLHEMAKYKDSTRLGPGTRLIGSIRCTPPNARSKRFPFQETEVDD